MRQGEQNVPGHPQSVPQNVAGHLQSVLLLPQPGEDGKSWALVNQVIDETHLVGHRLVSWTPLLAPVALTACSIGAELPKVKQMEEDICARHLTLLQSPSLPKLSESFPSPWVHSSTGCSSCLDPCFSLSIPEAGKGCIALNHRLPLAPSPLSHTELSPGYRCTVCPDTGAHRSNSHPASGKTHPPFSVSVLSHLHP